MVDPALLVNGARVRLKKDHPLRDPTEWCQPSFFEVTVTKANHKKGKVTVDGCGTCRNGSVQNTRWKLTVDVDEIDEFIEMKSQPCKRPPPGDTFGTHANKKKHRSCTQASSGIAHVPGPVKACAKKAVAKVLAGCQREPEVLNSWRLLSKSCKLEGIAATSQKTVNVLYVAIVGGGELTQGAVVEEESGRRYVLGTPFAERSRRQTQVAADAEAAAAAADALRKEQARLEANALADAQVEKMRLLEMEAADAKRYTHGMCVMAKVGGLPAMPALVISKEPVRMEGEELARRVWVRFFDGDLPQQPLIAFNSMWPLAEAIQLGFATQITSSMIKQSQYRGPDRTRAVSDKDKAEILEERMAAAKSIDGNSEASRELRTAMLEYGDQRLQPLQLENLIELRRRTAEVELNKAAATEQQATAARTTEVEAEDMEEDEDEVYHGPIQCRDDLIGRYLGVPTSHFYVESGGGRYLARVTRRLGKESVWYDIDGAEYRDHFTKLRQWLVSDEEATNVAWHGIDMDLDVADDDEQVDEDDRITVQAARELCEALEAEVRAASEAKGAAEAQVSVLSAAEGVAKAKAEADAEAAKEAERRACQSDEEARLAATATQQAATKAQQLQIQLGEVTTKLFNAKKAAEALTTAAEAETTAAEAETSALEAGARSKPKRRHALVVGNTYKGCEGISLLRCCKLDAQAMGKVLNSIGFEVKVLIDAKMSEMQRALRCLRGLIENGDEVVVYFSGHGISYGDVSYLVPQDMPVKARCAATAMCAFSARCKPPVTPLASQELSQAKDYAQEGIAVGDLAEYISMTTATKVIILDMCRDPPNPRAILDAVAKGGATSSSSTSFNVNANDFGMNTYRIESCGHQAQSYAGKTRNELSLMTLHLIPLMEEPNLGIYNLSCRLSRNVKKASEGGELGAQLVNLYVQSVEDDMWSFNPQ